MWQLAQCCLQFGYMLGVLKPSGLVQDMELGSHPDLESIPDDLASISDLVGSALKGASAPAMSSQQDDPSCPSVESNKALRRLLLKQMPSVEVRVWLVAGAATAHPMCKGLPKAFCLCFTVCMVQPACLFSRCICSCI